MSAGDSCFLIKLTQLQTDQLICANVQKFLSRLRSVSLFSLVHRQRGQSVDQGYVYAL